MEETPPKRQGNQSREESAPSYRLWGNSLWTLHFIQNFPKAWGQGLLQNVCVLGRGGLSLHCSEAIDTQNLSRWTHVLEKKKLRGGESAHIRDPRALALCAFWVGSFLLWEPDCAL